jgi:hypothetical protein
MRPRTLAVATLVIAGLYVTLGTACADVPTVEDIAACNQQAREGLRDRTVFPTRKDDTAAVVARTKRTVIGEGRGPTQSSDPQIHGMDGEGAKDAVYRAAYRVCMRRRGF